MPVPSVNNSHVAEALALLTGQFASDALTPNIRNFVRAKAQRWQDIEDTFWKVLNSQLLSVPSSQGGPSGQALDQLGDLVGEPRGDFDDVEYLLFIKVVISARKSGARAEDLQKVMQIAVGLGLFSYAEYDVGRVDLYAPNLATDLYARPLARALSLARPPGVFCELSYWDTPSYTLPIFVLGDSVSGTGGSGFQDQVSGAGAVVPISSLVF